MKKLNTFVLMLLATLTMLGQNDVLINITDDVSGANVSGVSVTLDGTTLQTDGNGNVAFNDILDGTYTYDVQDDCYLPFTGSLTVAGSPVIESASITALTTNDVFFFVGSPLTISGATVNMTGPNGYNETLTTGNPIGDLFEDVPYGVYDYTITKDCYETVTGSVTVECVGMGMGVSVFENPAEETTEDVFFFVGFPLTLSGAEVNLTGPNGYNETIITGNPVGDLFENVPYGEYNYTVTLDCYETETGTVTVECVPGPPSVTVSVVPVEETTEDVFFFVGFPLTLSGAEVNLTGPNGYNETIITGNPVGDLFENVPYGEYDYTITKDCYETITGSVTVECIGMGMGVSVFENPVEVVLDLTVTVDGTTLIANATGVDYQWIDCSTNEVIPGATDQAFEPTESGSYAVEITDVDSNCVGVSECVEVTILGTNDFDIAGSITVYPNPVRNILNVDFTTSRSSVTIQIANMAGQIVKQQTFNQTERFDMSVADLSSGVYIVKIDFDTNVFVTKIIKD